MQLQLDFGNVWQWCLEQVDLQLSRDFFPLPKLNILRKPDSIFDYEFEDFEIAGYESHPAIKAPVAI